MKHPAGIAAFIRAHRTDSQLVAVTLDAKSIEAHFTWKVVKLIVVTDFFVIIICRCDQRHITIAVDEHHFLTHKCGV